MQVRVSREKAKEHDQDILDLVTLDSHVRNASKLSKKQCIEPIMPFLKVDVQSISLKIHPHRRSKSRERKLRSMDSSIDGLDSVDLDRVVQDGLLEAELQSAGPTRSAVELSLDEDKVRHALTSISQCVLITLLHGVSLLCEIASLKITELQSA